MIKKMFELGVGIATTGVDVAKKTLNELYKKGHLTKRDRDVLIKKFSMESEKYRNLLIKIVRKEAEQIQKKLMDKAGYIKKSEYIKLEKRISKLEKQISKNKSVSGVKKTKKK
jgi:polyhydroxyalkanoate synthesis regulator phasin